MNTWLLWLVSLLCPGVSEQKADQDQSHTILSALFHMAWSQWIYATTAGYLAHSLSKPVHSSLARKTGRTEPERERFLHTWKTLFYQTTCCSVRDCFAFSLWSLSVVVLGNIRDTGDSREQVDLIVLIISCAILAQMTLNSFRVSLTELV